MKKEEIMELEIYPSIEKVENVEDYEKMPLSNLQHIGLISACLQPTMQTISTSLAMDGIYAVTIPEGMHLAALKDGTGYISTLLTENNHLMGQARMNKLDGVPIQQTLTAPINPVYIYMAAMLISIDKKLDTIQETQQRIVSCLKTKEHGEIKGNIKFLYDTLSNLKFHYNDTRYKQDYCLKVQDILQDSYQYMEVYKERLNNSLSNGISKVSSNKVKKDIHRISDDLNYYRMSIFMFSYAKYIEILLNDYIDQNIIQNELDKMNRLKLEYRKIYTDIYNYFESIMQQSLDKKAIKTFGSLTKGLGEIIHNVPVIEKGPIDETLIKIGDNIQNAENQSLIQSLELLRDLKQLNVDVFTKQLEKLELMYDGKQKILFDDKNLYVNKRFLA